MTPDFGGNFITTSLTRSIRKEPFCLAVHHLRLRKWADYSADRRRDPASGKSERCLVRTSRYEPSTSGQIRMSRVLETKARGKLYNALARVAGNARVRNLAKCAARRVRIWIRKLSMVEEVEEVSAYLQF